MYNGDFHIKRLTKTLQEGKTMRDEDKTRGQLIKELALVRQKSEARRESMERLRQTISPFVHQMSNAITTISGRAQLYELDPTSGDKLAEVCEDQTKRMLKLLRALSTIGKEMDT